MNWRQRRSRGDPCQLLLKPVRDRVQLRGEHLRPAAKAGEASGLEVAGGSGFFASDAGVGTLRQIVHAGNDGQFARSVLELGESRLHVLQIRLELGVDLAQLPILPLQPVQLSGVLGLNEQGPGRPGAHHRQCNRDHYGRDEPPRRETDTARARAAVRQQYQRVMLVIHRFFETDWVALG